MMPQDFAHMAMWWGPGVLLLLAFSYGLLRLAQVWIERSMDARRRQMESLFGMAEQYVKQFLNAQVSQAEALGRLASSVEQSDSRDSMEHQQILIALRAMHGDIKRLVHQAAEQRNYE
jgi:hypothetical protein